MNLVFILSLAVFSLCSNTLAFPFKNSGTGIRKENFENGNYLLEWEVDAENSEIYFSVSVKTLGFVGFGISPKLNPTGVAGGDVFIAGVLPDGIIYYGDFYGAENTLPGPVSDSNKSQDWNLISAYEDNGRTNITFSRKLEACDPEDISISTKTLSIMWCYGKNDKVEYHGPVHRGSVSSNMLYPPSPMTIQDNSAF